MWIWPLFAQPQGQGEGGGLASMMLMLGVVFAIFYFLVILPQRKTQRQREQMLSTVKRGDEIVTSGGIFGTVVGQKNDVVILKVDDQTKIRVQKSAIANVVKED